MDFVSMFLGRYNWLWSLRLQATDLPEDLWRARPNGPNSIAWLVWHTARVEDALTNRLVAVRTSDGKEVSTWKTAHDGSRHDEQCASRDLHPRLSRGDGLSPRSSHGGDQCCPSWFLTSWAIPMSSVDAIGTSGDGVSGECVYRPMLAGEEDAVHELVARVFAEFVGPGYSAEGQREFLTCIQPNALLQRAQAGHLSLLALVQGELVGVIEIRDYEHVSLLFVEAHFQRRGIARGLLRSGLRHCLDVKPSLTRVSVNSSPDAVAAYEHLGFHRVGPMEVRHGIEYVPMVLANVQTYAP